MENIEIDPVKEMQHLESMYKHYKILYRKFMFYAVQRNGKSLKLKEMNINRKYRE